jgi:hypothetical protein
LNGDRNLSNYKGRANTTRWPDPGVCGILENNLKNNSEKEKGDPERAKNRHMLPCVQAELAIVASF